MGINLGKSPEGSRNPDDDDDNAAHRDGAVPPHRDAHDARDAAPPRDGAPRFDGDDIRVPALLRAPVPPALRRWTLPIPRSVPGHP